MSVTRLNTMIDTFGSFLEFSIPTPDILRSLAFYRALGFTEIPTGDIRRHHYAVVTDGQIAIGLHGGGIGEAALAFVRPDLARHVRALADAGHEFEFQRLGTEEFNEAAVRSPDGHLILMMEARTFSPGEEDEVAAPLIGRCTEVLMTSADLRVTLEFFENAGFLATDEGEPDRAWLTTPGLTLALEAASRARGPVLRFAAPDAAEMLRQLEAMEMRAARAGGGWSLAAPEGTVLLIG